MAKSIEDLALQELPVRGLDFLAPCCEVCGCTLSHREQRLYVLEGGEEGSWPRMHEDCLDQLITDEHHGKPYTDSFAYSG